mmetsp:Transcript_12795/g.35393  ORF Transcript_12795/g.35393 Transcript_12795/m.35393 type:complete len:254 (+) Transcript_12795:355-1116(+)
MPEVQLCDYQMRLTHEGIALHRFAEERELFVHSQLRLTRHHPPVCIARRFLVLARDGGGAPFKDWWNGVKVLAHRTADGRNPIQGEGGAVVASVEAQGLFDLVVVPPTIHLDHLLEVVSDRDDHQLSDLGVRHIDHCSQSVARFHHVTCAKEGPFCRQGHGWRGICHHFCKPEEVPARHRPKKPRELLGVRSHNLTQPLPLVGVGRVPEIELEQVARVGRVEQARTADVRRLTPCAENAEGGGEVRAEGVARV